MNRPRVFLDADVIFAGAASPTEHGASHGVLRMGEITLIDCVTPAQLVAEMERNFEAKLPSKLPELRLILSRSLHVVPDPAPRDLNPHRRLADAKDLPILVAAIQADCRHLLTFNLRHYRSSLTDITVQRPGDFLGTVRALLAQLSSEDQERD